MDRVHSFLIAAAAAAAVVVIITRVFAGEPREYRDKRATRWNTENAPHLRQLTNLFGDNRLRQLRDRFYGRLDNHFAFHGR